MLVQGYTYYIDVNQSQQKWNCSGDQTGKWGALQYFFMAL